MLTIDIKENPFNDFSKIGIEQIKNAESLNRCFCSFISCLKGYCEIHIPEYANYIFGILTISVTADFEQKICVETRFLNHDREKPQKLNEFIDGVYLLLEDFLSKRI